MLLPRGRINYIEWARDSSSFVFAGSTPSIEGDWTHYDLNSDNFTESQIYPFLPQITAQEQTVFARAARPNGQSFFYVSPNGRYLVYAGAEPTVGWETQYWPWIIGDRQTQTFFNSTKPVFDPFSKINAFEVRWSEDSDSLVLIVCIDRLYCTPSVFIHIRGLESGLSGIVVDDSGMTFPIVGSVEYRTLGLFDFSRDGTWALLAVGEDGGQGAGHLMMYNAVNPQSSFLLTGLNAGGGRFATPDGSQILYIDNQGIYRYNWANNTSTLLTTEVNNAIAFRGEFSPDGRWFVFVNSSRELYLYDLQGLPDSVTNPGGGLGDPICPDGGGWTWINGVPVFVCDTLLE